MRTQVTEYLQLLVLNLFLIMGIWKLLQKDMLLGSFGDWMFKKLGKFYSKPVFDCPPCMSSIWGTAFFFAARLDSMMPWWLFPLHCLALCGLATVTMMLDHD